MRTEKYNIEGIEVEIEFNDRSEADAERMRIAYVFRAIREFSGMNRKEFSEWLEIPYRTMQEWELGRRVMPEYVLKLIAYKVANEKRREC
ncbi:helix-turn-helix domain-containing protein [Butyrivibrio sp. LB2008]|jgi:DNA-binding transcriptional regulator YiaG|uniref:helix-turn-helix domain-containing protein n=1 Tax=Butyrivibrio sp. LB2008 TaxID=1408305 RepID=UPI000A4986BF|nr:XRE family transcriptional regulator [Butyrivibrio sp. LB2008]